MLPLLVTLHFDSTVHAAALSVSLSCSCFLSSIIHILFLLSRPFFLDHHSSQGTRSLKVYEGNLIPRSVSSTAHRSFLFALSCSDQKTVSSTTMARIFPSSVCIFLMNLNDLFFDVQHAAISSLLICSVDRYAASTSNANSARCRYHSRLTAASCRK